MGIVNKIRNFTLCSLIPVIMATGCAKNNPLEPAMGPADVVVDIQNFNYTSKVGKNEPVSVNYSVVIKDKEGKAIEDANVSVAKIGWSDGINSAHDNMSISKASSTRYDISYTFTNGFTNHVKIGTGGNTQTKREGDKKFYHPNNSAIYDSLVSGAGDLTSVLWQYGLVVDITNAAPMDTTPPTGSLTNPGDQLTTDNPNDTVKNVSIDIIASDNTAVQSVVLHYKKSTEGSYSTISASNIGGDNWNASLPTDNDPALYDIKAKITDTSANTYETSVSQFQLYGTELWQETRAYQGFVAAGFQSGNATPNTTVDSKFVDYWFTMKGGQEIDPEGIFQCYAHSGDDTNPADTFPTRTFGSCNATMTKQQVYDAAVAFFNSLQPL